MGASADLVCELHGLIDRLLAVDTTILSADELASLVVGVQGECSRLTIAVADDLHRWVRRGIWQAGGSLNASLALGRVTKSDHRRAGFELRRARLLQRMPHTRAAVLAGRLSMDHVDLFVRFATVERFELFVEHETFLVERCAATSLFDDARKIIGYWAQLADDVLGGRRQRPDPSTLYLSRSSDTGEGTIDAHLCAIDTEIVAGELRRLAREIILEDRAGGIIRTPAQRRAVALVRMAARSVNANGVTTRPLLQIIIGDTTARRLCELASGAVIHPDDLASHIDDAVIESFLFDGPSTIIAKTDRRLFTGTLRRAIQIRDRRCQHASGCPTPAIDCDIDHRRPAARGGPTSQFNGHTECIPHNRLSGSACSTASSTPEPRRGNLLSTLHEVHRDRYHARSVPERDREPAARCFLVLLVHVSAGVAHGRDGLIE